MKNNIPASFFLFVLAILCACPADAGDFSYTYLEVALGKTCLDEKITVSEDGYDGLFLFAISGASRFDNGIVIGVDALIAGNKGDDTWVARYEYVLTGSYPIRMTNRVDLIPKLGLVTTRMLVSAEESTTLDSETRLSYGIGLRAWAIPENLEISCNWNDSSNDLSKPAFRLTGSIWWRENHSIGLATTIESEQASAGVFYRYSAFWN